jgi:hypothetical protein
MTRRARASSDCRWSTPDDAVTRFALAGKDEFAFLDLSDPRQFRMKAGREVRFAIDGAAG